MREQESNHSSFHLKNGTDKTGKLPVSEQYLYEKKIQDQTDQLTNHTDPDSNHTFSSGSRENPDPITPKSRLQY